MMAWSHIGSNPLPPKKGEKRNRLAAVRSFPFFFWGGGVQRLESFLDCCVFPSSAMGSPRDDGELCPHRCLFRAYVDLRRWCVFRSGASNSIVFQACSRHSPDNSKRVDPTVTGFNTRMGQRYLARATSTTVTILAKRWETTSR